MKAAPSLRVRLAWALADFRRPTRSQAAWLLLVLACAAALVAMVMLGGPGA